MSPGRRSELLLISIMANIIVNAYCSSPGSSLEGKGVWKCTCILTDITNVHLNYFLQLLPLALDRPWVEMQGRINGDRVLMEGKNASNVDVSLHRKLRQFFCPVCLTRKVASSDGHEGNNQHTYCQQHNVSLQDLPLVAPIHDDPEHFIEDFFKQSQSHRGLGDTYRMFSSNGIT